MPKMKPVRGARLVAGLALVLLLWVPACTTTTPRPQLTAAETAEVDRVVAYLNSIPRFEAHFIQFGSFGPDAGVIRLDRPAGDMRIDYAGSEGRFIVIAKGQVQIVDPSNGSTMTMPTSRTPLGMLLTPTLSFSGAVTVTKVVREPGIVQITLQKTNQASQGSLTLTLNDQPLGLVAVTVVDAHQRTLTMHLSNIDLAPKLTPSMFELKWTPSVGQETG
jgi:outer membrane lipoprotein-sorting protein